MKTVLLSISFILFVFLPSAHAQNYYQQNQKGLPANYLNSSGLRIAGTGGVDSSYFVLDYYTADSLLYAPNYKGLQGQLINSYYSFPADTLNSYRATSMFFMNYDCINSIAVAFDSLVNGSKGYSSDTVTGMQIDTLYIPLIQVNHSGRNDTLEISLTSVNATGYPTSGYILDTLVTGLNIGAGNNYTINTIKWSLGNYQFPSTKFAVTVTYFDSTKQDSCWFIYGYGYRTSSCSAEPTDTFAITTHFSNISARPKDFRANSFACWNGYRGKGLLPDETGDNVYYPCTITDTIYKPGIDGANYLQDIDIAATIFLSSTAGISTIHQARLNISQNYPNPFNNTTTINYTLLNSSPVSLKVVDLAGREIVSQNYGLMSSGQHTIILYANTYSAGVYFYSITGSGYTVTKKMVVY